MYKMSKYTGIWRVVLLVTILGGRCAEANICLGKTGLQADPDTCKGFISCGNGIAYKMACPAGLRFNVANKVCDWPRNVKCNTGKVTTTAAPPPPTTAPPPPPPTTAPPPPPTAAPPPLPPPLPCTTNNGGCSHMCLAVSGVVTCSCFLGYQLQGNGKTCSKVDPCAVKKGGCSHRCTSLKNVVMCLCPRGFKIDANGKTCVKSRTTVDPCNSNKGGCSHKCTSVSNVVKCSCPDGFKIFLDGKTCISQQNKWNQCGITGKVEVLSPLVLSVGTIVGGDKAIKGRWRWQGGLYYYDQFYCGGALINENLFLTAAHCVHGKESGRWTVKMGDYNRMLPEGEEQTLEVEKVITHKGWKSSILSPLSDDIAILKIKTKFVLNEHVGLACLPEANKAAPESATCYITGWGMTGIREDAATVLMEAELPIVPNAKCGERNIDMVGKSRITDKMLCAGILDAGSVVSGCKGDSGGPYVCRARGKETWVLQGVVSWGSKRCDAQHRHTVFTRVSKYIDWINTIRCQEISSNCN